MERNYRQGSIGFFGSRNEEITVQQVILAEKRVLRHLDKIDQCESVGGGYKFCAFCKYDSNNQKPQRSGRAISNLDYSETSY